MTTSILFVYLYCPYLLLAVKGALYMLPWILAVVIGIVMLMSSILGFNMLSTVCTVGSVTIRGIIGGIE